MQSLTMKPLLLAFLCISLLVFSSCGGDDEDSNEPDFNFISQNAQGKIEGLDFNFGEGAVSFTNSEFSVDLFDQSESIEDDVCSVGFGDEISVFFTVPSGSGVYPLSLDFSSAEGQTVTFYNPATNLNIIATEGAVEILTSTETTITGRIDARSGDGDFINGDFTLKRCN